MVIPDWTSTRPASVKVAFVKSEADVFNLARPVDRLGAVIIDVFILLAPLFLLLSSPMRRQIAAGFILGAEGDLIARIFVTFLIGALLIIFYQGLMHFFFGATVGKMIFRLRVVPVFPDGSLTLSSTFTRGFVWVMEVLFLGIPFLAVGSNKMRRTLHDRICDSVVIALNGNGVLAPVAWERRLTRGVLAFSFSFLMVVALVQAQDWLGKVADGETLGLIEEKIDECEAVSDNVGEEVSEHRRLQIAMSLYAAGLVDRSCLEAEVKLETAMNVRVGPLTYLAQAFVNSDDAEVSNSYLDQVCQESPDSVECSMSAVVNQWSGEDVDQLEQTLRKAKRGSGYLEVWGVRHFMKQGQYAEALSYLDALSEHRELAEFSLVQRVKALYNSYLSSEATVALAQALPTISPEDANEVSSWMCAQQLQNGCDSLAQLACRNFNTAHGGIQEIDFEYTSEALSKVMTLECHGGPNLDYASFGNSVQNGDWKNFFAALAIQQKGDKRSSFDLLQEVAESKTVPELLRVEAIRRAVEIANSEQFGLIQETWQRLENRESWGKVGNILLSKLAKAGHSEMALSMAHDLIGSNALAPQFVALVDTIAPVTRLPASQKARPVAKKKSREKQP